MRLQRLHPPPKLTCSFRGGSATGGWGLKSLSAASKEEVSGSAALPKNGSLQAFFTQACKAGVSGGVYTGGTKELRTPASAKPMQPGHGNRPQSRNLRRLEPSLFTFSHLEVCHLGLHVCCGGGSVE